MLRLLLAALLPIAAYLYMIYKIDRFDKEPKRLLIKLFIFGGLIAIPVVYVEGILNYMNIFAVTESDMKNFYTAFVVAAFTEELFKWFVVKKFAYSNHEYDERLDGIVYCVFVSLGFAAVENVGYVFSTNAISVAYMRAVTALPGHMLFGVVMGYYLSRQKFAVTAKGQKRAAFMSLFMPILVHGIYDYILMSQYKILLIGFIPFMIWLWFFGVKRIRKYYVESKTDAYPYHKNSGI